MKPGTRPMIRISAALAKALWPVDCRDVVRAVEVQRVSVRKAGTPGGKRPGRRGGGGVYRGGLFRKTTIRDMVARAVAVLPKGPERNTAKRYRQGRATWAEAFGGPSLIVDKRIARPIAGVSR